MPYKCLSIAGFDGSGGAGLQADLKTFSALECYGMTVLTALPIQNTQGVRHCYELPLAAIEAQLSAIFDDIKPDSIKIGMLFKRDIIELVRHFLTKHATGIPIVLDPVMVAKSGDHLLMPDAIDALKKLCPIVTLLTPNRPEASALTQLPNDDPMIAEKLLQLGAEAILLKGGHQPGDSSDDLLMFNQPHQEIWLKSPRINSKNTHGTGCTLSAAIAANLAKGISLVESCRMAKEYLYNAISASQLISVGHGHGPVHHFHNLWSRDGKNW